MRNVSPPQKNRDQHDDHKLDQKTTVPWAETMSYLKPMAEKKMIATRLVPRSSAVSKETRLGVVENARVHFLECPGCDDVVRGAGEETIRTSVRAHHAECAAIGLEFPPANGDVYVFCLPELRFCAAVGSERGAHLPRPDSSGADHRRTEPDEGLPPEANA